MVRRVADDYRHGSGVFRGLDELLHVLQHGLGLVDGLAVLDVHAVRVRAAPGLTHLGRVALHAHEMSEVRQNVPAGAVDVS